MKGSSSEVVESVPRPRSWILHLKMFKDADIIGILIKATQTSDEAAFNLLSLCSLLSSSKQRGVHKGYMAFVTVIANTIQEVAVQNRRVEVARILSGFSKVGFDVMMLEDQRWQGFYRGSIVTRNEIDNRSICSSVNATVIDSGDDDVSSFGAPRQNMV